MSKYPIFLANFMKKEKIQIELPEGTFDTNVLIFEDSDRENLKNIYKNWRNLCDELVEMDARKVNLPEGLSESATCLEMGFFRFTESISTANTSFDAYDPKTKKRIQIKACSILPDLTSFGPNSKWDEIYFIDFFRKGDWDGTFDIYLIPNELIYSHKVNKNQTLKEQQEQGRRPRFSIYKEIILANNISPVKTGKI
jgi:hypothetical protein